MKWFRKSPKSLVVFDNVESLETLQPFIPSDTVDIIITTRDSALVGSEIVPYGISIPLLDEKDATALFVLNLSTWSPSDTAAIRNEPDKIFGLETVSRVLAERFHLTSMSELRQIFALTDRLPLAIVQCASYLRQYPMPFFQYLDKFKTKAPETLRKFYSHPMKGATYHQSVMTTWDINLDRLGTNTVKMITFFGFLERSQITMPFLEHALDDCRFWGGKGCTPLPESLKEFFAFLDTRGDFYESIGALDSLSLITRDTALHRIYIHPMIHEYIHLRLPVDEAVIWLHNVTALLHHHLPPLLYSSRLDKDAAQQTEQVFSHLGRNSDLVESYQSRFSPDTANTSAVFFLEAYLWYRGLRYLDLAEKLMTQSAHPWDLEMLYGARLLAIVYSYQANPGEGLDTIAFDEYVGKIRNLPQEGRDRTGSKVILQQAALCHRWIDALIPSGSVSSELRLALSKMPSFSWQLDNPALSEEAIDRIAVAVFAHSKAKAILATSSPSEQYPEDRAVDLLWRARENTLLGLELECSELDHVFDDLLKYEVQVAMRRRAREDVRTLLKLITFYHAHSSNLYVHLDRRWDEIESALMTCVGESRLNEMAEIPQFILDDEFFTDRLLNSSALRDLIFAGLSEQEKWLKRKITNLEKQPSSEKRLLLLRRLKARLAEVLAKMGGNRVEETRKLLKDIFNSRVDLSEIPGDSLANFGERLLESVPDAKTFYTNAPFYREIVAVLLSMRTEQGDALVRHWAGHLYSILEEESSETVLPHLCSILIPSWNYEARRSTQHDQHTMDLLDRLGFYIISLPGPADVWPMTSLRAYRLSRDICGELQAKANINYKRIREWIAKVDDFDGLFGRFGSWRDMPITARDIMEITLAGTRLQRCAAGEDSVKQELLQRSYDKKKLEESFRLPLPAVTTLAIAHEPTFVPLPLGRILGTTTQLVAASYHGPRCGIWVVRETTNSRGILFWTRTEQAGVFYIDITEKNILHRFFNSWREYSLIYLFSFAPSHWLCSIYQDSEDMWQCFLTTITWLTRVSNIVCFSCTTCPMEIVSTNSVVDHSVPHSLTISITRAVRF